MLFVHSERAFSPRMRHFVLYSLLGQHDRSFVQLYNFGFQGSQLGLHNSVVISYAKNKHLYNDARINFHLFVVGTLVLVYSLSMLIDFYPLHNAVPQMKNVFIITSQMIIWLVGYPYFLNYAMMNENLYLGLSNVWVTNILLNLTFRSRSGLNVIPSLAFSFLLCVFPSLHIIDTKFWDPFSFSFYMKFILLHCVQIVILTLQKRFGSYFFLPSRWRRRVYDKFVKSINGVDIIRHNQEILCSL